MSGQSKKRLGELLIEAGVIDETQLKAALGHQRQWGVRIGQALVEMKLATEADVVQALARRQGFDVARLDALEPYGHEQALALVPREFAVRNNVFPMQADTSTLVIAMSDPTNLALIDELRFRTGRRVKVAIGGDREIATAVQTAYPAGDEIEAISLDVDAGELQGEAVFDPFGGGSEEAMDAFFGSAVEAPAAPVVTAPAAAEPARPIPSPSPSDVPVAPRTAAPAPAAPQVHAPAPAAPQVRAPAPAAPQVRAPAPAAPQVRAPAPAAPQVRAPAPAAPQVRAPAPAAPRVAIPAPGHAPQPSGRPASAVPSPAPPAAPAPAVLPAGGVRPLSGAEPVEEEIAITSDDALSEPSSPAAPHPSPLEVGARQLTAEEQAVLAALERLAAGAPAEPEIVKPTQAFAAVIRLLLRKGIIDAVELLDELERRR